MTVTSVDNRLHFSNNGKRFPCLIFYVNRRELTQVPIELIYERLISKNDLIAKELADKMIKVNDLMKIPKI